MPADLSASLKELIRANRFLAHDALFAHRHEYPFAPYHKELIADFWSPSWNYIDLGFRECGKTTLCEEAITIAAVESSFRNCLIVGAKEELAAELLVNIKSELENNEAITSLYGDQHGDTWTQTKITLRSGICIQARGVGQTMRGTQHRNWRPDLVIVNDFEDDEEVLTPEGRRRTLRWFLKVLLPACDRRRRKIRIYDTVRDSESVPMMLIKRERWPHRFVPISYLDNSGVERSSWPQHPTLTMEWIDRERATYARLGEMDIWEREYMCNAATQADRSFTPDMLHVQPVERDWQAVYAMIDPARSIRRSAATTGWAVWSWVRGRLIVWDAGGKHMLPDEIIDLAYRINRDYQPIEIGIEEDGLNEWLMQPIRARMSRDGAVPVRGVPAPRNKIDFIRGLQPFFAAGEVSLGREMPELREQLLGFPTGKIDAPNALAYALLMRPGRLIYESWRPEAHVELGEPVWGRPCFLLVGAGKTRVAAALAQFSDGRTRIFGDWIVEGDPGESLESVLREASIAAGGARLTMIAPHPHWEQYRNVGLVQAARSLGLDCRSGGDPARGRETIRRDLERHSAAGAAFAVSPTARWTMNALAGGYSRPLRDASLAAEPTDNQYRLLMEAIESAVALVSQISEEEDDDTQNFAYADDGRRYRSAMPQGRYAARQH